MPATGSWSAAALLHCAAVDNRGLVVTPSMAGQGVTLELHPAGVLCVALMVACKRPMV